MNEDEAKAWLKARATPDQMERINAFTSMVIAENARQNLIATSTIDEIWVRHILDSAQLLQWVRPTTDDVWVDVGTGAGFPGIVCAVLAQCQFALVEPRRRRADYLERAIRTLNLNNVHILCQKVESAQIRATVISGRAVAPLENFIMSALQVTDKNTLWLLHKGRNWQSELLQAPHRWQNAFHVKHSLTNDESVVLIGRGISR